MDRNTTKTIKAKRRYKYLYDRSTYDNHYAKGNRNP